MAIRRLEQLAALRVGEPDLHDPLEPSAAQLAGHAAEDVAESELPLQPRRTRQDPPLVERDGLHHLHRGRARRVVRRAGLEEADDLGAPVPGAADDRSQGLGGDELAHRNARDGGVRDQRHHGIAVAAEHHGLDVFDRDVERLGQEHAVARGVEHARHAEHPLAGEAARLHGHVAHDVERIRDHDDDRPGSHPGNLRGHRAHDPGVGLDQVVAAHARLAGDPRGDHEQLGARGLVVPVGAQHSSVEPLDGARLPLVQRLALRHPLDHVDHHHGPRELLLGQPLRRGGADVARSDDRHFLEHARRFRV
jgi:hypothetical protein